MRRLIEIRPETWDTRIITKFILIPRTLRRHDGSPEMRWLEKARILQQLEPYQHRIGAPRFWEDQAWAD